MFDTVYEFLFYNGKLVDILCTKNIYVGTLHVLLNNILQS